MSRPTILISALFIFTLLASLFGQSLLEENFDYPAGDTLTNHGWTQIRNGTPITVSSPGLDYPGYPLSGIGNAAHLVNNGDQELRHNFMSIDSGSVYVSLLVRISESPLLFTSPFIYLTPANGSIFKRKLTLYAAKDDSQKVAFGLANNSGIKTTKFIYELNTTYLLVLKYAFNSDTTDTVSMWVNPDISTPEPLPDRVRETGSEAAELSEIILSQIGNAEGTPDVIIDGIRITTSWEQIAVSIRNTLQHKPSGFRLLQNYPNPFNPETIIKYHLARQSHIHLSVYNMLGQKICTLVNEKQTAGSHTVRWAVGALSGGIYFYRLTSDGQSQTKRMLYLK